MIFSLLLIHNHDMFSITRVLHSLPMVKIHPGASESVEEALVLVSSQVN